ncbi:hypothetical protein [Oryzicola mucosus]|uniref:hypothetical protein n=1 Tax=Oryzicola mucosus TaxID=2767425 RepID=UPI002EDB9586
MPGLTGCTSAKVANSALAEPNVIMVANPQPPYTYWAPENSTIRNHPRERGIWIAETKDGSRKYYFGDQCRASDYQRFVGQPMDALPKKPANATWRLGCSTCAHTSDLVRTRMNVTHSEKTGAINEIYCG